MASLIGNDGLSILQGKVVDIPNGRVHRIFEKHLAEGGDCSSRRCAVIDGNNSITFGELNQKANRLARRLVSLLEAQAPRVGILMPSSIDRLVLILAILKSGASYVPLEPRFPVNRILDILEVARPSLVVVDVAARFTAERTKGVSFKVIRHETVMDEAQLLRGDNLNDDEEASEDTTLSAACVTVFTSGSVGAPKGVQLTHANLFNAAQAVVEIYANAEEDTTIHFISVASVASPVEIFSSLLYLTPLVIVPNEAKENTLKFIDLLVVHRITRILWIPLAVIRNIVKEAENEKVKEKLERIKIIGSGAEIIPGHIVQAFLRVFPRKRFVHILGMSETTMFTVAHVVEAGKKIALDPKGHVPVGFPNSNINVYLLDNDNNPVPLGAEGQIAYSGASVATDYIGDEDPNKFLPNNIMEKAGHECVFLSGDFGRIDGGLLYFQGRQHFRVKVRGFTVSLPEVERAIEKVTGVHRAAVIGHKKDSESDDVILVAYYECSEGSVSPSLVVSHLEANLPEYIRPRLFEIPSLPYRPPLNKVDYQALDLIYKKYIESVRAEVQLTAVDTLNPVVIIAEVLEVPVKDITASSSIFDLGANSGNIIQIQERLASAGHTIDLAHLLSARTIQDILTVCEAERVQMQDVLNDAKTLYSIEDLQGNPDEKVAVELLVNSLLAKRYDVVAQPGNITRAEMTEYVNFHTSSSETTEGNLSFIVRRRDDKAIQGCCLLTSDNPIVGFTKTHSPNYGHPWLTLASEESALKLANDKRLIWATCLGIDSCLGPSDAMTLTRLAIEECVRRGNTLEYDYVHFGTANPTIKGILLSKGAKVASEIQINQFKLHGAKPYHAATDSVVRSSLLLQLESCRNNKQQVDNSK